MRSDSKAISSFQGATYKPCLFPGRIPRTGFFVTFIADKQVKMTWRDCTGEILDFIMELEHDGTGLEHSHGSHYYFQFCVFDLDFVLTR